jgi:peptidoglycan/LPS O-acetylase OafA/YrhL
MNRTLSVYLDVLRFGAALVVFLSHAGTKRISGGLLYHFQPYGQLAVDVFFVLSGLVIAHTVQSRETGARSYAINRAARIYSVALPSLVLGLLLDAIGRAANPDVYAQLAYFQPADWPHQFTASVLFLNEIWFNAVAPGSNLPYWSLGFEVWYYVAFGAAMFGRAAWRWPAAAAVLVFAGPKIAILFPLWLLGAGVYHACRRWAVPPRLGWLLCLAPLLLLPFLLSLHARSHWPFGILDSSWGFAIDSRWDYVAGLALAIHLIGVHALHGRIPACPERLAVAIRRVANATFTLYLLHVPLIHCLVAVMPWPNTAWQARAVVFLGAPLALLALAQVTERRRDLWRRGFNAVLPRRQIAG